VLLVIVAAGPSGGAKATVAYMFRDLGAYQVTEVPDEVRADVQCFARTSSGQISALADDGTVLGSRPNW
jgi:RNase adaptor protein for sRNA GlmZ degradation